MSVLFRPVAAMRAVLLAASALAIAPMAALAEIAVHDAYAIAATPQAMTGAAFMTIHNHGGAPDRLLAVRSTAAARTELHTHVAGEDGMMRMVHVAEGRALPTDGELLLARGGDHVMFMGLTQPFADGLVFDLVLVFEVAGEVVVPVAVDLSRLAEDPAATGVMDHTAMQHPATDAGD